MGAKGSLTLFRDLIITEPVMKVQRQGRNQDLIAQRNECLIDRYFFYVNHTDKRYNSILQILQGEFFINSTFTIPQVLDDNYDSLMELKKTQPSKEYFKKKWPHLTW